MLNWLRRLRKRVAVNNSTNPTALYVKDLPDKVGFAFETGGVKYYRFIELTNMPIGRFNAMRDMLELAQCNTTADIYKANLTLWLSQCNEGKLVDIASGLKEAQARLDNITSISVLYDLASVFYFDENENLLSYDPTYANKKISFWNEKGGIAFFLQLPIRELMPSQGISTHDMESYMKGMAITELKELENLYTLLRMKQGTDGIVQTLLWRMVALKNLKQSKD